MWYILLQLYTPLREFIAVCLLCPHLDDRIVCQEDPACQVGVLVGFSDVLRVNVGHLHSIRVRSPQLGAFHQRPVRHVHGEALNKGRVFLLISTVTHQIIHGADGHCCFWGTQCLNDVI